MSKKTNKMSIGQFWDFYYKKWPQKQTNPETVPPVCAFCPVLSRPENWSHKSDFKFSPYHQIPHCSSANQTAQADHESALVPPFHGPL